MRFKIKYTKLGNQFFFISNLAEWHFSCRTHYNEKWIKEGGPLSYQEKKALKEFGRIMKKYTFRQKNKTDVYLGIPFITFPNTLAWERVERWVNKKEYLKIKEIFNVFSVRFKKNWLAGYKELKKAKLKLEKELNKKKNIEILRILSNLFSNKELLNEDIEIYLLISPSKTGMGGGANIGPESITFECSDIKKDDLPRALLIIFHEISHLFERKELNSLLKKYINNLNKKEKEKIKKSKIYQEIKDFEIIINEMIVSSLLPEGYLSERLTGKKIIKLIVRKQRTFKNLRYYGAYYLYSLVREYIKRQKPLDEIFIRKTFQLFKRFEHL
ncbi:hypothetical protein KKD72_02825 [Patescibacteria group bacterium]|nr:hypothetical protein [Patescibacteria group bacterium]